MEQLIAKAKLPTVSVVTLSDDEVELQQRKFDADTGVRIESAEVIGSVSRQQLQERITLLQEFLDTYFTK